MPDREIHNAIAKLFTNLPDKDVDWVNRTIDSKIMLAMHGPQHRKYWGHDISSLALMMASSSIKDKSEIAKAWYVHMQLDNMPKRQQRRLEALTKILGKV